MSKIGHVDRVEAKEVEKVVGAVLPEQGFTVKESRTAPNPECVGCDVPFCRGVAAGMVCIKPEDHGLNG